jgi:hypothetical protein
MREHRQREEGIHARPSSASVTVLAPAAHQIGIDFNGYGNGKSNVKGTLVRAGKRYDVKTDDNVPANGFVRRDLEYKNGKVVTLKRGDRLHLILVVDVPWYAGRDKNCQSVTLDY